MLVPTVLSTLGRSIKSFVLDAICPLLLDLIVMYTSTLNTYPLLVEFDCRLYFTDLIFRPQWYPSSPPWHDCSVYLETYPSISPPYFYSHLCPWWQSTTFFSNLIVVCLHSTLYLMIHALVVALTLKIPVLDDNTLLFKFDVVYFLSSQSLMIKYTLSPSYSNDVLISFRLHPVASVRSLRYVIHPYFVAYACSIILTSTPRRNCIRRMGCQ